jgi:hypothetical protein
MNHRHAGITRITLVLALVILTCGLAHAESREIYDRFNIRVGFVGTDTKTDLAAGRILGAVVRIEDVLGYENNDQTFGVSGFYRFRHRQKGRHGITFRLFDSRRDSRGIISGSVPILDREFIGAFSSEYDTTTFGLGYRYSLIRTENAEAGLFLGLSTIKYEFKLAGVVDGDGGPNNTKAESADFLAPLPTAGFFLRYAVTDNLIFNISADALDIEVSDIEGRVLNTRTGLTWYFIRNMGVGIGFGSSDVDVTKSGPGKLLKVNFRQNTATFSFSFVL